MPLEEKSRRDSRRDSQKKTFRVSLLQLSVLSVMIHVCMCVPDWSGQFVREYIRPKILKLFHYSGWLLSDTEKFQILNFRPFFES